MDMFDTMAFYAGPDCDDLIKLAAELREYKPKPGQVIIDNDRSNKAKPQRRQPNRSEPNKRSMSSDALNQAGEQNQRGKSTMHDSSSKKPGGSPRKPDKPKPKQGPKPPRGETTFRDMSGNRSGDKPKRPKKGPITIEHTGSNKPTSVKTQKIKKSPSNPRNLPAVVGDKKNLPAVSRPRRVGPKADKNTARTARKGAEEAKKWLTGKRKGQLAVGAVIGAAATHKYLSKKKDSEKRGSARDLMLTSFLSSLDAQTKEAFDWQSAFNVAKSKATELGQKATRAGHGLLDKVEDRMLPTKGTGDAIKRTLTRKARNVKMTLNEHGVKVSHDKQAGVWDKVKGKVSEGIKSQAGKMRAAVPGMLIQAAGVGQAKLRGALTGKNMGMGSGESLAEATRQMGGEARARKTVSRIMGTSRKAGVTNMGDKSRVTQAIGARHGGAALTRDMQMDAPRAKSKAMEFASKVKKRLTGSGLSQAGVKSDIKSKKVISKEVGVGGARRVATITPSSAGLATHAHEAGHAKGMLEGSQLSRIMGKSQEVGSTVGGLLADRGSRLAPVATALGHAPTLFEEGRASVKAMKGLNKAFKGSNLSPELRRGAMVDAGKDLATGFGTYLGRAVGDTVSSHAVSKFQRESAAKLKKK